MGAQPSAAVATLSDAPLERRERRPVALRGYVTRADRSGAEVLLLDLSYEGCGIETPVVFDEGEALELRVVRRGMIEARVRWCRDGKAGLVFESEPPPEKQHWPRRFDRTSLSAEVSMRRLGRINYRVRVFDLSPGGCRIELVDAPRVEEHVFVKFDGLESLQGEVCWVEGNTAGLHFTKPIHPAVFDLLLDRLG